jgi:hypothetical protein
MRSRLPGKLRSSSELLGAMVVKNGTRFAKRGFVIRAFTGQILHDTDQAPGQHETKAEQQQHSDRETHGHSPQLKPAAIIKCGVFLRL